MSHRLVIVSICSLLFRSSPVGYCIILEMIQLQEINISGLYRRRQQNSKRGEWDQFLLFQKNWGKLAQLTQVRNTIFSQKHAKLLTRLRGERQELQKLNCSVQGGKAYLTTSSIYYIIKTVERNYQVCYQKLEITILIDGKKINIYTVNCGESRLYIYTVDCDGSKL